MATLLWVPMLHAVKSNLVLVPTKLYDLCWAKAQACHVYVTNGGQCEIQVMASPINSPPPALIEALRVPHLISELITFEPLAIITPTSRKRNSF